MDVEPADAADDHSKAPSWPGWSDANAHFGLEMQSPFANHLLTGTKTIETRAYALPPALLSVADKEEKIHILESVKGQDGVSSIPNIVSLMTNTNNTTNNNPSLIRKGWCTFTKSFRYESREQFEADADKHLVDLSSKYDWSDHRPMYGWVVGSCMKYEQDVSSDTEYIAKRRMRSLFEISCQNGKHMPKILITGASGMLGRALHRLLLNDPSSIYKIIGTGHTRLQVDHHPDYFSPSKNENIISKPKPVHLHYLNLLDFTVLAEFLDEHQPDVVVHCAAERYPDAFETKLEQSMKLNVDSTRQLARECQRLASSKQVRPHLIYISTSYVFDGGISSHEYPPYRPQSKVNPVNNYGRSKLQGERAVTEELGDRGIVVRVPLLYGEDCSDLSESPALELMKVFLPQNIETSAAAAVPNRKMIDHWALRFPTNVDDVARVLKLMIDRIVENKFPGGTYHISSPHGTTKYELMQLQAKLMNISTSRVEELTEGDSSGPPRNSAPRPQCTKLDCSETWSALGMKPGEEYGFVSLRDGMKRALSGFPERFTNA